MSEDRQILQQPNNSTVKFNFKTTLGEVAMYHVGSCFFGSNAVVIVYQLFEAVLFVQVDLVLLCIFS
jgi:hypothetical protein